MTIIDLIVAILIALSSDDPCSIGKPVDWYEWAYSHENAVVVFTTNSLPDVRDAWLYHDAGTDEWLLFVFRENVESVLVVGRNDPHGACAIEVMP